MPDVPIVIDGKVGTRYTWDAKNRRPVVGSAVARRYRAMHIGDSIMLGLGFPGGSRNVFGQRLRAQRGDVQCMGPVFAGTDANAWPFEPLCAAYSGETIEQITARLRPGGSIHAFVAVHGTPDMAFYRAGQNNVRVLNQSAAEVEAALSKAFDALTALMPLTVKAIHTLTYNYPRAAHAALNLTIDAVNAWLRRVVWNRPGFVLLDTGPKVSAGDVSVSDGIHPNTSGQNLLGVDEADAFDSAFPLREGFRQPRAFAPLAPQASALFADKAADHIAAADNGWRLPADSFLYRLRADFSDVTNAAALTNIFCSTPALQDYTKGIGVAVDNTGTYTGQTALRVNVRGPAVQQPAVLPTTAPCDLFVHGDRPRGVVSVWLGSQQSASLPYTPANAQALTLLAVAFGVPPWAAGDPSPVLTVGAYAGAGVDGFAGAVRDVRLSVGAAAVGSFWEARWLCEAMFFDAQGDVATTTGYLPCSDGSGGSVASGVGGGVAGTLVGGWSAAGTVVWPNDG